jgi:hypothetical protein
MLRILALVAALALAACDTKPKATTATAVPPQGVLTATVTETVTTTKTVNCVTVTKSGESYLCTPESAPPTDCTANPSAPGCTPPPTGTIGVDGVDWSLAATTCPSGSMVITGKWGVGTIYTSEGPNAPFNQQWLAVEVKVPAGWTSESLKDSTWVEYIDGAPTRKAMFASQPCTFDTKYALKANGGTGSTQLIQNQIGFGFKYKTGAPSNNGVTLIAGKTYWINAKNLYGDGSASCTGSCNMRGNIDK